MSKILALDLGEQWVGSALSDTTKTFARPYMTVTRSQLESFLEKTFEEEIIETVVVGHPRTLQGKASAQTLRVEQIFSKLQNQFSKPRWVFWDERLSSKRAASSQQKKIPTKEERLKSHSIAAAYILDSYLTFLKEHLFPQ